MIHFRRQRQQGFNDRRMNCDDEIRQAESLAKSQVTGTHIRRHAGQAQPVPNHFESVFPILPRIEIIERLGELSPEQPDGRDELRGDDHKFRAWMSFLNFCKKPIVSRSENSSIRTFVTPGLRSME